MFFAFFYQYIKHLLGTRLFLFLLFFFFLFVTLFLLLLIFFSVEFLSYTNNLTTIYMIHMSICYMYVRGKQNFITEKTFTCLDGWVDKQRLCFIQHEYAKQRF